MPPKKQFPEIAGVCGDHVKWKLCASGNCKFYIQTASGMKEHAVRMKNVTDDVTEVVAGKVRALGFEALLPSDPMQTNEGSTPLAAALSDMAPSRPSRELDRLLVAANAAPDEPETKVPITHRMLPHFFEISD
jgi:hypothetical protein